MAPRANTATRPTLSALSSARQPEMMNPLQVKFFIIAGLLDAVSMIGVVIALILVFGNPLLSALNS